MIEINIHEAKTHLSRHLNQLKPGERIILCKRHIPVAEIRLLKPKDNPKRVIGLAKGEFTVPESFFEELPADILDGFNGD